jgi:hypothetical protein
MNKETLELLQTVLSPTVEAAEDPDEARAALATGTPSGAMVFDVMTGLTLACLEHSQDVVAVRKRVIDALCDIQLQLNRFSWKLIDANRAAEKQGKPQ